MLKLLDTYRSILRYVGCQDIEGRIHAKINDSEESVPLDLQGHPWVLPTDKNLREAYQEGYAVFHPLNENLLKGESNDIKRLKSCISIRLNYTIYQLFANLLRLASSPKIHKQFNPEQDKLCVALKNVKDDQVTRFVELGLDVLNKRDLYGFVFVSLKRGGTLDKERFSRTGNISFPFYEKLKEEADICEKKIKNTDRDLYIRLCEYVFPDIDKLSAYSYGSNDNTAPFLESLLKSTYNVVDRIVEIFDTFEEFIDMPSIFEFDVNWLEPFEDLPGYEKEIRTVLVSQSSNDTLVDKGNNGQPNQVSIVNNGNGVSPMNLFQSLNQRVPQQPVMGMMMQPAIAFPPQGNMYPQQPMVQQQPIPSWAMATTPTYPVQQQQVYQNQPGYTGIPQMFYQQPQGYQQQQVVPFNGYQPQGYGRPIDIQPQQQQRPLTLSNVIASR